MLIYLIPARLVGYKKMEVVAGGWNLWGSIAGFISAFLLLIIAKQLEKYFSKEQREMAKVDRENKQSADSLRAQLDGWKNYAEQLTEFNKELNDRVNGFEIRLNERNKQIDNLEIKVSQCERDKARLWRRIEELGGT